MATKTRNGGGDHVRFGPTELDRTEKDRSNFRPKYTAQLVQFTEPKPDRVEFRAEIYNWTRSIYRAGWDRSDPVQ